MTSRQTSITPSQRITPYSKTLRSSCRYCRKRKIKCDGNIPCGLCTSRKIDCVHDERAKMGRPLKENEETSLSSTSQQNQVQINLGSILDSAFHDTFIGDMPTTAFNAAVHGYLREHGQLLESQIDPFHKAQQKPCTPDVYDIFYPLIIKDILDGCRWHFSSLSLSQMNEGERQGKAPQGKRPAYFPIGMRIDQTISMNSSNYRTGSSNSYPELNLDELKRLYDVWKAVHPLSSCVPFSAIEGNSNSNKSIRHLVISEAQQLEGEEYVKSEEHFFYACQLFRQVQIPVFDDDKDREGETIQTLLSACQASLLFGWHDFANGRAKRGATYMSASGQLFGRLQMITSGNDVQNDSNIEIIQSLSSIFSLMTLWAFSQLDRSTGNLGIGWTGNDPLTNQNKIIRPAQIIVTDVVVRLCSVLLDNHPNVVSSTHARSQNVNEDQTNQQQQELVIAQILYSHICSIKFMKDVELAKDNQKKTKKVVEMVEGIRDCVRLILLLPGKRDILPIPYVGQELLIVCQSALDHLIKLAGFNQDPQSDDVLFANVAFSRGNNVQNNSIPDGQDPMRKTIAAYIFDLLAQTSERVCENVSNSEIYSNLNEWKVIFQKIADIKLDLLETSSLIISRQTIKESLNKVSQFASSIGNSPSTIIGMDLSSPLFTPTHTTSSIVTPDPSNSSMVVTPDASTIDAGLILDHLSFDFSNTNDEERDEFNSSNKNEKNQDENLFNLLWGYFPASVD